MVTLPVRSPRFFSVNCGLPTKKFCCRTDGRRGPKESIVVCDEEYRDGLRFW